MVCDVYLICTRRHRMMTLQRALARDGNRIIASQDLESAKILI